MSRMEVFLSSCHSLSTVYVPGWPGAQHSADICEHLEDWSGGLDAFHTSDTDEEVLVQLVRKKTTFHATFTLLCFIPLPSSIRRRHMALTITTVCLGCRK